MAKPNKSTPQITTPTLAEVLPINHSYEILDSVKINKS